MPNEKLSVQEFAAQIKSKYPAYESYDDSVLVDAILQKFPMYKESVDYSPKKKKLQFQNPRLPIYNHSLKGLITRKQTTGQPKRIKIFNALKVWIQKLPILLISRSTTGWRKLLLYLRL